MGRLTDQGRKLLEELEGRRSHAYRDSAGLLTIGVGHLLTRDELSSGKLWVGGTSFRWRDGLTEMQIDALLDQDLKPVEEAVMALVRVPLTPTQRDALICWTFNVGRGAAAKSSLIRLLNQGLYGLVPVQLKRWVYAGGDRVEGLARRREREAALWQGETT